MMNNFLKEEASLLEDYLNQRKWIRDEHQDMKYSYDTIPSADMIDVRILQQVQIYIEKYPNIWMDWLDHHYENTSSSSTTSNVMTTTSRYDILYELLQLQSSICYISLQHRKWTLLHYLCYNGNTTPIHIVSYVAKVYPNAIVLPDSWGDTCLHIVARNTSQFSSIKLRCLLQACIDPTNAVVIQNRLGGTVLHAASNGAASYDTIQLIVETNPNILNVVSYEGIHAITALWYSYSDTIPGYMTIVRVLDGDMEYGQRTKSFIQFWSKVEYLATHYFLHSDKCPMDVYNKYIKDDASSDDDKNNNNSHMSSDENDLKNYTLHGLILCRVPMNMIKICIQYNPQSNNVIDNHGNYPLHTLIETRPYYHHTSSSSHYNTKVTTTRSGTTTTTGTTKSSTSSKNNNNKEYEIIQLCIQMGHPGIVGTPNYEHYIPLQIAIQNKIPLSMGIYDLLLHQIPSTIRYRDYYTNLYPFQFAAIQGCNDLQAIETIFYFLIQQPDVLFS